MPKPMTKVTAELVLLKVEGCSSHRCVICGDKIKPYGDGVEVWKVDVDGRTERGETYFVEPLCVDTVLSDLAVASDFQIWVSRMLVGY